MRTGAAEDSGYLDKLDGLLGGVHFGRLSLCLVFLKYVLATSFRYEPFQQYRCDTNVYAERNRRIVNLVGDINLL
jgi:hypothetical protein